MPRVSNVKPFTPDQIAMIRRHLEQGGTMEELRRVTGHYLRVEFNTALHRSGWRVQNVLVPRRTQRLLPPPGQRPLSADDLTRLQTFLWDGAGSERGAARAMGYATREKFRTALHRSGWRITRALVPIETVLPAEDTECANVDDSDEEE